MDAKLLGTDMEDYLRTLVERGKDNMTLLLYLQKDYCVSWSLSTLKRRLKDWNIKRHGEYTPDNVRRAVQKELQTARKLVGIKRMYQRLRQHHHMLVKRDQVEAIMVEQNYSAMLKRRCGRLQIGERRRFFSKGPNWSWHLDGYDKLLGYKRNKFPFAVHGCIDSFSRKILWMRVHLSNKSPNRIALYFWETVIAENVYPRRTRSDAGTEVGLLAQCQMFLHRNTDVKDVHVYGSSITNQCIESWWAQLRKYNAQYWIDEFKDLECSELYDPDISNDRMCLTAVYMPLIKKELDDFVDEWNTHRIRKQNRVLRPCGIPEDIYNFPENHGGIECGFKPRQSDIDEIERRHNFYEHTDGYLPEDFREKVKQLNLDVNISNARECYLELRDHFASTCT